MGSVEEIKNSKTVICSCGNQIINRLSPPKPGDKCMACQIKQDEKIACQKKINW